MSFKIYTKTGDKGSTSLIGGTKVSKAHIRIESYGTVDELNSFIGFCVDQLESFAIKNVLREVQDRLFTIGSSLACDPAKETKMRIPDLHEEDMVKFISPIREKATAIRNDEKYLREIMEKGAEKAKISAKATLEMVREAMGLNYF